MCPTILSNEAMKPSKLLRNIEAHHGSLKAKPIEYMQQMLRDFKGQMTNYVKDQLMAKLQTVQGFSLLIDETTDVTNDAQLLAFVYFEDSSTMCEEFLFCKPLPTMTDGS